MIHEGVILDPGSGLNPGAVQPWSRTSNRSHTAIHSSMTFSKKKQKTKKTLSFEISLEDFTLGHINMKTTKYQDTKRGVGENNNLPEFSH